MKAILMAAGKGTRISRMVADIPKSTLPINGEPLIRRTVKLLQKFEIDCVVCVGYRKEKIYEALDGLKVTYCVNPFYNVTNSIASLWFARAYVQGDMLLLNADVFFTEEILKLILNDNRNVVLAIDKSRIEEGDYFFKTTNNGCITKYGKDLPLEDRSCEYVGICKIQRDFCQIFLQRMELLIGRAQHGLWWENVLYSFTDEHEIYTIDVRGKFWAEIDYFDDYERILKYIEAQQQSEEEQFVSNDTRVYGRPVKINMDHVKDFYEQRAASAAETGYNAVLLGSQDPEAVEQKNRFERDYILPMLGIDSSSRVLDIGCGIGRWAEFVLPICGFYCGTDFTKGMAKTTQSVCRRIGGNFQVHNLSYAETVAQTAKYFGGKFDAVIVAGVCAYINDQDLTKIFRRLPELLKPSCKLFFTEPVGLEKRLTLNEFPSEALQTVYSAIYRTPEEYNCLYAPLMDAGLSVLKQEFIPNYGENYTDSGRWYTILQR